MSEMNLTPQGWFQYLLGVLVTLLASIFEVYRRKIEKISDQHVTRDELRAYMDQMRDDRIEMHRENTRRLERIEDKVDR